MDENSCENETSESVDGQKEKETESANELENAGVNIDSKGKRKLNQVSDYGKSSSDGSHDGSGPSTDFSSPMVENDSGGKITPSLVNTQTVKSTTSVQENEITIEKSIKDPHTNEPELTESLATFSMEENAIEPQDSSASIEENVQYQKILPLQQENSIDASVASPSALSNYEEQQEIQTRVRLAPGVEEQLSMRRSGVGPPPSYSFVMKQKKKMKPVPSIDPFVANTSPPPTYSGTRNIFFTPEERVCNFPSFAEPIWRSHSQPALCPRCGIIVLTTTHTHDSKVTHVAALALCLLGCWPCCFLPYCMNVCRNTYHHCPICQTFLGIYRPW